MPELQVEPDPEALKLDNEFKAALGQFQDRLKEDIFTGLLTRGLILMILVFLFGLLSFGSFRTLPPTVSRLLESILIH